MDYCIVSGIGKSNRSFLFLLILSLLMSILTVKSLWAITNIKRRVTLVLLIFVVHGGCFQMIGIWNNRLIGDTFWKLICGLLVWVPTRSSYRWPEFFLDMALLCHICDRSHLNCQTTLLHSHYNFHYGGCWSQIDSKPCWPTAQLPQFMNS